ncbi:PglZ domain-containing protein, partial [bacterium]|nr:PglZ domain-containing protein [bacterium]
RAHSNLRTSDSDRFTDHDFQAIVAFAALGVAESAFKKLDAQDYWKIGLMAHETLEELESLAPDVTKPILKEIRKAPAPFCWFAEHDAALVIRAFYISVLLAQHVQHWKLLLANIDPSLKPLSNIDPEILFESAPKLIEMDPKQADRDLQSVEDSLDRDAIRFVLLEELNLSEPDGFVSVIEQENYSTLFRSLALLMALGNLLSENPNIEGHNRIFKVLFPEDKGEKARFVDTRSSVSWSHLKEAYELALDIRLFREKLSGAIKTLKVLKTEKLTFKYFRDLWNNEKINRLEYFLSALERLLYSGVFLPRPDNELPSFFINVLEKIRQRIQVIIEEVNRQLDEINL